MDARDLADLPLTYDEVGATGAELPAGYDHLHVLERVGEGREAFDRLAEAIMTWGIQTGAGFGVTPDTLRAAVGTNLIVTVKLGPTGIDAPCRVVHVIESERVVGFTYGTLRGHPSRGEESFTVTIDRDGVVRFEIIAFSRPATILAKLGAPVGRRIQAWASKRYVRAARAAAVGA